MEAQRRRRWMGALFLGLLAAACALVGAQDLLLETEYYVIPMGTVVLDQAALIEAARSHGYTVIVRSGDVVTAYRGGLDSAEDEAALLGDRPLLYADHGDTLLLFAGSDFDFSLRPGMDGYDLVLSPHVAVPTGTAFGAALTQLHALGIIGTAVGVEAPQAYARDPLKGPRPPEGVAIDSDLYALVVAENWFLEAESKGIERVGLRVEAVAEKLEGAIVPAELQPFLLEETAELARFLVPIHRLVDLASTGAFRLVRPAHVPQPAAD
ncbi:MAG: hypothetical protein JSW65_06890 [Candidatus Bipolaricaulota bacterium]|nr:MAG: hypothetical protein JSW65_06890 [Candidatus Bipolaricaulota bacterium]